MTTDTTVVEGHDQRPPTPNRRVIQPLRDFLAAENAGAFLLVLGAVSALIWANSPWSSTYHHLFETRAGFHVGALHLDLNLEQWINDGLMALFFLVVGLEIKRELIEGELASVRKAALPALAAIGGMVVPALIYVVATAGTPHVGAWGIPMATDIALALGVVTVLGARIAPAGKVFLLALAIVDDLGAILVIAIFYSEGIRGVYLVGAGVCVLAVMALVRWRPGFTPGFVVLGVILWFCTHEAGIHATLAGVVMGFLTPTSPHADLDSVDYDKVSDLSSLDAARETITIARGSISRVEWVEHTLHPWTSLVIVPIFALANAGISFSGTSASTLFSSRVVIGIVAGLVIGKPIGVGLAVWLGRRFGLSLPDGVTNRDIAVLGLVAGIGFTVSLFVTGLAIDDVATANAARLAVLAASLMAALLATIFAMLLPAPLTQDSEESSSSMSGASAPTVVESP